MKPTYEELEVELAQTKTELAEVKAELRKANDLLRIALAKITELEEKINLNSRNSSKPPSTDRKRNTPDKDKKKRS